MFILSWAILSRAVLIPSPTLYVEAMNMFFQKQGEAQLHYGSSDFTILEGGSYVTCAVSGEQIPLEELRYWNDERQEAYKDAGAALKGFQRAGAA